MAAPFPILLMIFARSGESKETVDYAFIVGNALLLMAIFGAVAAVWRLVRRRTHPGHHASGRAPVAALCVGCAFGLASPIQMAWKDDCNDSGGVVPVLAAAPVALGLTQVPASYSGSTTLAGCLAAARPARYAPDHRAGESRALSDALGRAATGSFGGTLRNGT